MNNIECWKVKMENVLFCLKSELKLLDWKMCVARGRRIVKHLSY